MLSPLRLDQTFDGESGLYYLRARYYYPTTPQFLSTDPAVSTTRSPFAYVAGNPLNATDPSGMFCLFGHTVSLNPAAMAQNSDCSPTYNHVVDEATNAAYSGVLTAGEAAKNPWNWAIVLSRHVDERD